MGLNFSFKNLILSVSWNYMYSDTTVNTVWSSPYTLFSIAPYGFLV